MGRSSTILRTGEIPPALSEGFPTGCSKIELGSLLGGESILVSLSSSLGQHDHLLLHGHLSALSLDKSVPWLVLAQVTALCWPPVFLRPKPAAFWQSQGNC